jgi:hypothetical protein
MNTGTWNPWKVTAIGMALVMATALIVGIVVGGWYGLPSETRPAAEDRPASAPTLIAHVVPTTTAAVIAQCEGYAASLTGQRAERDRASALAYSSCMSAQGYN